MYLFFILFTCENRQLMIDLNVALFAAPNYP